MDFSRFLSVRGRKPTSSSANSVKGDEHVKKHLPLIASPVNEDLHHALASNGSFNMEKLKQRPQSIDSISTTSSGNPIIYKRHQEASTIELFYDLFFVANLAYFTAMHQHVDSKSVLNYLKLFTLMWFTWLSTILFDVRFVTDSVFGRLCKLVHFGVFTGYVFAGPVFDTTDKVEDQRYYRAFAMVLAVSRLTIALQYMVVMWQSRRFKKTLLPLGLTTLVYVASAVVFLSVHFAFTGTGKIVFTELLVLFAVSIIEGLAAMGIAIFWRIISFKYTHLVERVGLLSLILMGEGIIGMIKSVSCVTKGQATNNSAEIGNVVAACVLIYLVWMLYFDAIDHHRFGTIRQQIWALLHFPLHVAILLLVEGQTALIVWNSVVQGLKFVWKTRPLPRSAPGTSFANSDDFVKFLDVSMNAIDKQFKSASWKAHYDWKANLTSIKDISSSLTFKSPEWNNATVPIVEKMWTSASVFIFEAHKETLDKMLAIMPVVKDDQESLNAIYAVFDVVVLYFFVCAGGMLLVMAIMYWFGKLHKTKYEFGEMINRTIVGFTIPAIGVVATLTNKTETGFKIVASNWLIPIVVFGFLIVIMLDNVLQAIAYMTSKRKSSRWSGGTYVRSPNQEDDEDDDTRSLVKGAKSTVAFDTRASSIYQPYEPYAASAQATPELPHAPVSRTASPGQESPQIPVSMIMQGNFRPSHARTRSAGYAAVSGEHDDDLEDQVHGYGAQLPAADNRV